MKPKIKSDALLSVVTDVFWQKGERTKTHQGYTFHTSNPWTKFPG